MPTPEGGPGPAVGFAARGPLRRASGRRAGATAASARPPAHTTRGSRHTKRDARRPGEPVRVLVPHRSGPTAPRGRRHSPRINSRAGVPCGSSLVARRPGSCRMQADRYAGIAHHARHHVDVVFAGQLIDVRRVMAVRNRDGSAPDRVVDPRGAGQLPVGAAHGHQFAMHDARGGAVIGMDEDLGSFAEKIELPIELVALPAGHHHQRRGWL
jgi:hypothetical protein